MCESLLSLLGNSFLFQTTFYKKEHLVFQYGFKTDFFHIHIDIQICIHSIKHIMLIIAYISQNTTF